MKSGAVRMNDGVAAKTTTARGRGLEKTVPSSPVARGNRVPIAKAPVLGGSASKSAPVLGGSASKSAPVLSGSATKSGGLQIRATGTARPAATQASAKVKGKALGSPGKPDLFQGDAHKLYTQHGKNNSMTKNQFGAMMKALQKEGKFKFPSEEKLQGFIEREFPKHDVAPKNNKWSFDEFLEFYGKWMDEGAREQVETQHKTGRRGSVCAETAFMRYDADHDFTMTASDLRSLVEEMQPVGQPKPAEKELQACVDEILKVNDVNANGGLSFEEFAAGYDRLLDRAGFRGLIREETDQEKLEQAVKHQFDGHLWIVSEQQMHEAEWRAKQSGKFALFFDAPPGDLDLPTVRYAAKMGGRCKVFDVQGLLLSGHDMGHESYTRDGGGSKVTDDETCAQLRDAVLECMATGTQLVLRLGKTAPDFMGSWNRKDLPLDFLLPENAAAGPLQPALHKMVQPPAEPSNFTVVEGYRLVVTSCFDMNSYYGYLRAKLPLQHMQPIQVLKSLTEVAEVLEYGLPKSSEEDDAFAEMDRLADML